jgi:hypothetical protein
MRKAIERLSTEESLALLLLDPTHLESVDGQCPTANGVRLEVVWFNLSVDKNVVVPKAVK